MEKSNPFLIRGYSSPEYFCDREEETKKIISAYKNGRNLTLFSLRRMGKTSLIKNVFYNLSQNANVKLLYLDIFATSNLTEFINELGKALITPFKKDKKNIIEIISRTLKSVTPAIVFDKLTGEPSLQFSFKNNREEAATIKEIFDYLNSRKTKILIAIDEFQQILNYPEKNVEALLRTHISNSNKLNFIFSGSERHLLLSMFNDQSRPFYQTSESLHLDTIAKDQYVRFIMKHFEQSKMIISEESINFILDWTRCYTYYTQYACNKIFEKNEKKITIESIKKTFSDILNSNENIYLHYRNLLSDFQWKTLKAIAKEERATMVTSKEFIRKHDLNAASSVQTAIAALEKKDFITAGNGEYFLNDVFLSKWLERN